MSRPWFAPKTIGYGATPTTWEGWLVILLFVALVTITGSYFSPDQRLFHLLGLEHVPLLRDLRPSVFEVAAALAVELVALIAVARWKSSGPWMWRG